MLLENMHAQEEQFLAMWCSSSQQLQGIWLVQKAWPRTQESDSDTDRYKN